MRRSMHGRNICAGAAVIAGLALAAAAPLAGPALASSGGTVVRYDLNGPAGVVHEHTADGEATVEEIGADFDGLGKLTGWNTKRDGTGKAYKTGDGVSGEVTLYAQYDDATMLADGLTVIGGKTYYYVDGKAKTGFVKVKGLGGAASATAYFDPEDAGAMAVPSGGGGAEWIEVGGESYLVDGDGALMGTVEGQQDDDAHEVHDGLTVYTDDGGRAYAFEAGGRQVTGAVDLEGRKYLFIGAPTGGAQGGYRVTGRLVDAAEAGLGQAGARLYPTADGLAAGIVGVGGETYFFGEDGVSSEGWHETDEEGERAWVYTGIDGRVAKTSATDPSKTDDSDKDAGKGDSGKSEDKGADGADAPNADNAGSGGNAEEADPGKGGSGKGDGSSKDQGGDRPGDDSDAPSDAGEGDSDKGGSGGDAEEADPDKGGSNEGDSSGTGEGGAALDRGHLGGAASVSGAGLLAALDDARAGKLGEAIAKAAASAGAGDGFTVAIESCSSNNKVTASVAGKRYLFKWSDSSQGWAYWLLGEDSSSASSAGAQDGGDMPRTGVGAGSLALASGGSAASALAGVALARSRNRQNR